MGGASSLLDNDEESNEGTPTNNAATPGAGRIAAVSQSAAGSSARPPQGTAGANGRLPQGAAASSTLPTEGAAGSSARLPRRAATSTPNIQAPLTPSSSLTVRPRSSSRPGLDSRKESEPAILRTTTSELYLGIARGIANFWKTARIVPLVTIESPLLQSKSQQNQAKQAKKSHIPIPIPVSEEKVRKAISHVDQRQPGTSKKSIATSPLHFPKEFFDVGAREPAPDMEYKVPERKKNFYDLQQPIKPKPDTIVEVPPSAPETEPPELTDEEIETERMRLIYEQIEVYLPGHTLTLEELMDPKIVLAYLLAQKKKKLEAERVAKKAAKLEALRKSREPKELIMVGDPKTVTGPRVLVDVFWHDITGQNLGPLEILARPKMQPHFLKLTKWFLVRILIVLVNSASFSFGLGYYVVMEYQDTVARDVLMPAHFYPDWGFFQVLDFMAVSYAIGFFSWGVIYYTDPKIWLWRTYQFTRKTRWALFFAMTFYLFVILLFRIYQMSLFKKDVSDRLWIKWKLENIEYLIDLHEYYDCCGIVNATDFERFPGTISRYTKARTESQKAIAKKYRDPYTRYPHFCCDRDPDKEFLDTEFPCEFRPHFNLTYQIGCLDSSLWSVYTIYGLQLLFVLTNLVACGGLFFCLVVHEVLILKAYAPPRIVKSKVVKDKYDWVTIH